MVGLSLAAPVQAQDPTPEADTWIEADWTIVGRQLDLFDVNGTIGVHEAVVEGDHLTADAIRDRYRQDEDAGEGDAFKEAIEAEIREEVASALDRFFPDASRNIDRVRVVDDSLTAEAGGSPYHPTVDVDVEASVDTPLPGDEPENVTRRRAVDALRMGAVTGIDLPVEAEAGTNHTVTFHLPPEVRTVEQVPTPIEVEVSNWDGSEIDGETLRVDVTGEDATRFEEADGTVTVRVDLHDASLDALTGTGTVQADVAIDAAIRAVAVPASMRDRVPADVTLDAVGADGVRLALDRGYLTSDWSDQARDRFADRVRDALRSAFGTDVPVDVQLDETTLQGGIDGDPDADPPLTLQATARAEQRFSAFGSPTQAAIVLSTVDQTVPLDAFPPFETRYEILVPDGTTLESARLDGSGTLQQTHVDGRDALDVTVGPDAEGSTATMSLGVTPGLLVGASPLIAVVVLVVVAVVVLGTLKVVKGRRGDGEGAGGA